MVFNSSDIQALVSNANAHACPNVKTAVRLLGRLHDYTNENSDGWAYARPVTKSTEKLANLLKSRGNIWYPLHGSITLAELKAAITPIKRMATTQKKKQAQYGNTFDFDVAAALKA